MSDNHLWYAYHMGFEAGVDSRINPFHEIQSNPHQENDPRWEHWNKGFADGVFETRVWSGSE